MRNPAMPADGTSEPLSSLSSADVSLPFSSLGSSSQDKQSLSPTSVPHNIRPNTLNTSGSDAYWFAHAADPPHERIPSRQNDTPPSERPDEQLEAGARRYLDDNQTVESDTSPGSRAGAAFARARGNLVSPSPGPNNEYKEDASPLSQKEREERFRQFKERQEEERQRRLHELQQQSVLAQKFREQQEEERKRRIDELRQKDLERRMAVEERKRQIWEAEQERKEAILRRNLDREAKIEARRNAQRNSMSFAFGSSTPRVIDLDLGGFGRANPGNPFVTLMPSVNGKRNEENDLYKRRAPSTDLLDQRPDEFDSFDSPLDYHKRSPTDPKQLNRRSFAGMSSEATKACLTIPDYNHSYALGREHPMSSSHHDLWSNTFTSFGWLSGSGVITGEDPMSRSMVILPSASRGRRRTDLTPTIPWERESSIRSHSPASSSGLSASKRAVSMSRLDILAQPRRRYVVDHSPSTSNIASSISHGGTGCSTSGNTTPGGPRTTSSKLRKDSPSRPRSSMSVASEVSGTSSMASTVSMRSHSGPRRPRPASMAGAIPDTTQQVPTPPQRQSRTERKNLPVGVTPPRPPRAKSVGPDALPPPKPPPRRTSPAKSVHSEQVVPANDKPIASVLPNTVEATTPVPKPEQSADAMPAQEPIMENEGPAKVTPPEPEKPKVASVTSEVSKPSKDDDGTTGEQQTQPIPGTIAKPRITSEEEAKAALAEKRRLAREQAEREAKLERQRQEELQRQEVERIRKEEEEQRRMEEEQIRLAVELRRQEEEKLQRAIKEQEEREVEERKRLEEEVRLKAEKEEQDKKAKEEAEKVRKETEEKLKKEEEERAERKRRVEQIMKRTRAAKAQKEDQISISEQSMVSAPNLLEETRAPVNGQATTDAAPVAENDISIKEVVNSEVLSDSITGDNGDLVKVNSASATVLTDQLTLGLEQNGLSQINSVSSEIAPMAKSLVESQNKLEHYNGTVIQTNGYSNLGEDFKEDISTNSDVKGDTKVENLLDFDSFPQGTQPIGSSSPPPPAQFDEIIDLSQLPATTTLSNVASNENEVNLFNQESDDLNSNRMVSNNPFIAFEDNVTKKQEATFTDLLS